MRHRVYGKHLGRNKDERDNLFKGLVQALLTHGSIQTSQTRAKAIKGLVDKVITSAKDKHRQSKLQSFLTDKNLRERLIKEIVPKLGTRTSGFTSVVRMGTRIGDQTTMVRMSLIGAEELKPIKKESRVKSQSFDVAQDDPERSRTGQESSEKNAQVLEVKKQAPKPAPVKKIVKKSATKRGGKKS